MGEGEQQKKDAAEEAAAENGAAQAEEAPESATSEGKAEAASKVALDELVEGVEESAGGAADPREVRVAELEKELAATKDQLMRAVADVQNARKRADKERRDAEAYGGMRLARDMLTVYDNLEAGLKAASDELQEREAEFFNGVELTLRNMLNAFEKHQIAKVEPEKGDKFDPNKHQAMFEAPTADVPPGTVSEVLQPGFVIGERLMRPALVGVAKKPQGDG